MKMIQIDIPDWTAEQITAKSHGLGISPGELIRALVCSTAQAFDPLTQRNFTVPESMEHLFPHERFMVVGRQEHRVTLTPTRYVPFEQALQAFQANGLSEKEILEILDK